MILSPSGFLCLSLTRSLARYVCPFYTTTTIRKVTVPYTLSNDFRKRGGHPRGGQCPLSPSQDQLDEICDYLFMETTQLNIAQFPSDLHTWLKIEAARRGVRMRDLVVEILTVAKSGTGA
jgi:hypothetical protein